MPTIYDSLWAPVGHSPTTLTGTSLTSSLPLTLEALERQARMREREYMILTEEVLRRNGKTTIPVGWQEDKPMSILQQLRNEIDSWCGKILEE